MVNEAGADYAPVRSAPWRYRVDPVTRFVYLNGDLLLPQYFGALADATAELVHDNLLLLPVRGHTAHTRRSG